MKPRARHVTTLTTALMFALPAVALAVCVALVNSTMVVKGVIVSPNAGFVGCQDDEGWRGVPGRTMVQVYGTPVGNPEEQPRIFLAGHGNPLDTFYVGIHVPYDPDLRRQDRLVLYFDADNTGTLTQGDFALLYEVGPDVTVASGEDCNKDPGYAAIYHYVPNTPNNGWGDPSPSMAGITSKVAYDYDDADAENHLWEIEIGIDRASLGLNAAGFRVGAKLYPHEEAVGDIWQTWIWPKFTDVSDPYLYFPGDEVVDAGKLETVNFTNCADVVIDAISATAPDGSNNVFRRPKSNEWVNGVLPVNLRNSFTASLRFYNPTEPTDHSALAALNSGTVDFTIRPWGGGNFLGERLMDSQPVSFDSLGEDSTVSVLWPVNYADYQPIERDMLYAGGHACLRVNALNFAVNLDPASDVRYRNLTYTPLSKVVDTFMVSTRTPELREGTQSIAFLMRANWNNLPRLAPGWTFRITSLDTLPFTNIANGYYKFSMKPQQDRRFQLEMNGGLMPIHMLKFTLDPRAGGVAALAGDGLAPLDIPVKEGQQITIVAQGRIRVLGDTLFNGANGRTDRESSHRPFLLRGSPVGPARHMGAVIGSFNKFRTSFFIGADRSFIVPKGATQLSVGINDIVGQFKDNRDGAFTLYVGVTEPHRLPTQYVDPGNLKMDQPALAEPAANLPRLDVDVFQSTAVRPPAGRSTGSAGGLLIRPFSYVSYAVYETHPRTTCGCGSCSGNQTLSLGGFFGSTALGLFLVRRRVRKSKRQE
jgi:hypothetical protein